MSEFEDHEGNGTVADAIYDEENGGRDGEIEDQLDSKPKRESRDHERETSRSKDREREKGRDKDRERDSEVSRRSRDRDGEKSKERSRDKDRDHRERHHRSSRHRDHSRDRSERRERGGRDDDDYRRSRDRDHDRRRDDRGGRRSRRSRSRSKDRSERRTRSRSPSKSKQRVSGFDMAPPASAMLAAGAAVTGQVPPAPPTLPGAGMFPNMFPLPTGQSFGGLSMMPIQAMTQQATRHARRVYVGGLSPTANEQSVATFFSQVMAAVGGNTAGPGDAVVNVYINHEKKFAFVEMRSVEEASNAMSLDGIIFEGAPVKVLLSFGGLKGFDLVKDRETGNSKGYAFCVYQDLSVTDIACAALNGIKMGDKTLTVRRANQGTMLQKPEQENRVMLQPGAVATTVVCLTQVVTEDELRDDEEYGDIMEDMRQEGGKFGALTNVVIPRPSPNGEPVPGLGKVFLKYADTDGSTRARFGMNGRKFGGNEVVAVYYPEDKFEQGDYGA
ncbi:unnamed protein product [Arabidopsis thaliana]|uniref:(thale cress) hypothetical protein n=1 Tax=Arabidopsis thaliana TaxID=3702 RepID=A0A7G2F3S6_ARATH|nr:unnamed protein product [Arabidopsis thaliana]